MKVDCFFYGFQLNRNARSQFSRFKLGSTAILCFPEDCIDFLDEIKALITDNPLTMGQALADKD